MNQKKIDLVVASAWKVRNLAHQAGLEAEKTLFLLGMITDKQRLFVSKKERQSVDMDKTIV